MTCPVNCTIACRTTPPERLVNGKILPPENDHPYCGECGRSQCLSCKNTVETGEGPYCPTCTGQREEAHREQGVEWAQQDAYEDAHGIGGDDE